MKQLLPSLSNLPLVYLLALTLLSMLMLAIVNLTLRLQHDARRSTAMFGAKLLAATPLLLLGAIWTWIGVYTLGVVALMGGSYTFLLATLGLVLLYALFAWGAVRWIRGRRFGDASVILLVVTLFASIFLMQRVWICEPLARAGVGIAQVCTAQLYEAGTGGVIARRDSAREWYRRAADKGIANAQYWMAMDARGINERSSWLQLAAEQEYAPAAYQLFLQGNPDAGIARGWLEIAAGEDYPPALYRLGLLHSQGEGVPHDLPLARDLMHRAADAGHVTAMRALALAYARGVAFGIDRDASQRWEQRALQAAAEEDRTQLNAGERYLADRWQGELLALRRNADAIAGNETDALRRFSDDIRRAAKDNPAQMARGIRILEEGAAGGDPELQYTVANYYLRLASSAETDTQKALLWLTKAAENGHRAALRRLIEAYKEGQLGLAVDLYKAKALSEVLFDVLKEEGVARNNPSWLGPSWDYDDTLKKIKRIESMPEPIGVIEARASAGDAEAQYRLAKDISFYGNDFEKSQALLKSSAAGGYPQAQYELASATFNRKRTDAEERQAIEWLYSAADNGHRGAMVWLGTQYLSGFERHNIERNFYQAKLWLQRSLAGSGDIVYRQKTSATTAWHVSADSVRKKLQQIPASILRLDLEGLDPAERSAAISKWYLQEQDALLLRSEHAGAGELAELQAERETLRSQRDVLQAAANQP